MIKEKLKILDAILSSLENSENYSLTVLEIYDKISPDKSLPSTTKTVDYFDPRDELLKILSYLDRVNLIKPKKDANNSFEITYEGVLKLSQGGFLKEHQYRSWKNRLNSFFWLFTPIIAFLSFVLTLLNIFDKI